MYFFDQYSDVDKSVMEKLATAGVVFNPDEDTTKLADRDFAVIVMGEKRAHRQFPIHNKENTAISYAYFMENKDRMGPTLEKVAGSRIKEACARFGLDHRGTLDSYELGLTPGENHRVPYTVIRKEAMDRSLQKTASSTTENKETTPAPAEINPNIVNDMAFRSRNLTADQQFNYVKLAEAAHSGEVTPEEAIAVVHHLDQLYNIDQYNRRMTPEQVVTKQASSLDPEEVWERMWGIEKVASTAEKVLEVLNGIHREEFIREMKLQFGKDMTEGFVENPEVVFNSLPKPHQEVIRGIAESLT